MIWVFGIIGFWLVSSTIGMAIYGFNKSLEEKEWEFMYVVHWVFWLWIPLYYLCWAIYALIEIGVNRARKGKP